MQLVTQKVPGTNLLWPTLSLFLPFGDLFGVKFRFFFVLGNKELGENFFPIKDLVVVLIQWLLYFNIYAVLHTLYSRKKIDKTFSPPLLTSDFQYTAVTFS